jgi:hypothetical protein
VGFLSVGDGADVLPVLVRVCWEVLRHLRAPRNHTAYVASISKRIEKKNDVGSRSRCLRCSRPEFASPRSHRQT